MSARLKPKCGPPVPDPMVVACRTAIETSDDLVEVVEATLRLRDLLLPILPIGGGMAFGSLARQHAENVVEVLCARGLAVVAVESFPNETAVGMSTETETP